MEASTMMQRTVSNDSLLCVSKKTVKVQLLRMPEFENVIIGSWKERGERKTNGVVYSIRQPIISVHSGCSNQWVAKGQWATFITSRLVAAVIVWNKPESEPTSHCLSLTLQTNLVMITQTNKTSCSPKNCKSPLSPLITLMGEVVNKEILHRLR